MKISIVTISYNQASFLPRAIDSILSQQGDFDLEYIVVDPGSTDGSREIIDSYGSDIDERIYRPDQGPADGLNSGFRLATGDVLGYLNADDLLLPGTLATVARYFRSSGAQDVYYGHGVVVDGDDNVLRKCFSDSFSLKYVAHRSCVVVQPSTFFLAQAYRKTRGFNVDNRSNWDGELLVDLALAGASFEKVNAFLSGYRLHGDSITGTGRLEMLHSVHGENMRHKIAQATGRIYPRKYDVLYRVLKHLKAPRATYERVLRGPIFARKE